MAANTSAATTAQTRMNVEDRTIAVLSSEQTGWSECKNQEQYAERDRRRPGWSVEGRGEALDDAEHHRCDQRAGNAAESAEHANGEDASDIFAPDRRLDRLNDDEQRARDRGGRDRNGESDALDPRRRRSHQLHPKLVLRHRHDGPAD